MQLNELRKIIKIPSDELAKNKWDFSVSPEELFTSRKDLIVSLGESQVLRWIDDIKGLSGVSDLIKQQKRTIRFLRKEAENASTPKQRNSYRAKVKREYEKLNNLQFIPEYVSVVMKNAKHYDRANKGFKINGVEYRRFLGTTGGVKQSTIVYVSAASYPQLMERLDNGRNLNKAMVPAKLGAYQALACSASRPLPMPKGFIVVDDCITHFTDDVIVISDGENGEPKLEHIDGYPMERNNSDGFGLMLPSYSRRINQELNGIDGTISGVNTRFAYCKGMIFTFDFIEFAEKVAKTYEIIDAWGQKRDVRDAEVILTVSMLKLWNSYDSWEDYFSNCVKHGYQFSACKATPEALENVRTTNYQFLQSYQFSDADIEQLAKATVDEINDVLGIENNRKQIKLLEEAAQRLYKEWFVDLRFPGHENTPIVDGVPEGWVTGKFSDCTDIMSGGTPKTDVAEFYRGNIPFYTPKDSDGAFFAFDTLTHISESGLAHCNSKFYPAGTVIITARGTVGKTTILAVPMAMNQSCYALKSDTLNSPYYLFFSLNLEVEKLKTMANGGVFNTIIVKTFDQISLTIPQKEVLQAFDQRVTPIMEQIKAKMGQISLLKEARDRLLPKLMNGEIEV